MSASMEQNGDAKLAGSRGAKRWDDSRFQWQAWREQHLYSMVSSLGRLWQHKGSTLFTLLVVALALILPVLLAITLRNLEGMTDSMQRSSDVTVFLKSSVNQSEAETLLKQWRALNNVQSIELQTPEAGLHELRDLPGFGAALDALDRNPLPYVLHLLPRSAARADMQALAQTLDANAAVEFVQYDHRWFERLQSALAVIRRLALIIAALFGLGAILIIGNTIRMDVTQRAEEIRVLQSLGASDAFVRRPHLYAGAWYGFWGAVLALVGVWAAQLALQKPVLKLANLYESGYRLSGLGIDMIAYTLVFGLLIGWLGARWASQHQIAATRLQ